ncbi:glycosyl hydrolase family 18 protein [Andreprevotia chitinilytica]|uniref:glycosyl hydrolase family 18 protein n=1 Tax=Andreprevotia chitinilytica TaxID=396808 RepID=UPI000689B276|nr:glycosyl hydrolase family 18 protein [Andreprevotia chitinilytica]
MKRYTPSTKHLTLLGGLLLGLYGTHVQAACSPWTEGATYSVGQVVSHNGENYTARLAHTLPAGSGLNPLLLLNSHWDRGGTCDDDAPDLPATPPYDPFGSHPVKFLQTSGKVVGVYLPNWRSVSLVDQMRGHNVSHVLYAFMHICGPGQLPTDAAACQGKQDFQLATSSLDDDYNAAFMRLKQRAPHVRVVASVGGWGGSDPFFYLANDAAKRAVFAASAKDFLRKHPAFDGIDIDWENPTTNWAANGVQLGTPADGQGFADLMHDLRGELDQLGGETRRHYSVTAAINTVSSMVSQINYRDAQKSMDYIFMMTYDFYGNWSSNVGNHTALYANTNNDAQLNVAGAVQNLLNAGVPAHKLVVGAGMYGRGFSGVVPTAAGSVIGGSKTGVYPGADGSETYSTLYSNYIGSAGAGINGYQVIYDPQGHSYNLWNAASKVFIGYDDPRAVAEKGRYVRSKQLAGIFAWEYSQDNGDILNAMNFGIGNRYIGQ